MIYCIIYYININTILPSISVIVVISTSCLVVVATSRVISNTTSKFFNAALWKYTTLTARYDILAIISKLVWVRVIISEQRQWVGFHFNFLRHLNCHIAFIVTTDHFTLYFFNFSADDSFFLMFWKCRCAVRLLYIVWSGLCTVDMYSSTQSCVFEWVKVSILY